MFMTEELYKQLKEWLVKNEAKIVEKGGFLKAPRAWVEKYQEVAEQCLKYETDNDLLPI